jgi:CubicO group peptidase (beta-lactamase class C family)
MVVLEKSMQKKIISLSFKNASKTLAMFIGKKEIAGGAAAMVQHGQVIYRDYAGYANAEKKQPIGLDTIYAIHSMSKVITSVSLLRLYEQGLFHMHQPVYEFLPNYKDQNVAVDKGDGKYELEKAKSPVTMKQLFTMTSGVSYPNDETTAGRIMKETQAKLREKGFVTKEFVNEVGKVPLAFHPGEKYMYGFSLDVLGAVAETITGKRFGDYLKDEIFEPLGMKDTGFYQTKEQLDRVAVIYNVGDGKLVPVPSMGRGPGTDRPAFEAGGGGLYSTIMDYGRFAQMLLNGGALDGVRILGRKTIDLMTSNHLNAVQNQMFLDSHIGQKGCSYGLSVRVRTSIADSGLNISPGEYGWDGAAGCWVSIDPKEDLYVLFMIQRRPGGQNWVHYRMLQSMYAGL